MVVPVSLQISQKLHRHYLWITMVQLCTLAKKIVIIELSRAFITQKSSKMKGERQQKIIDSAGLQDLETIED